MTVQSTIQVHRCAYGVHEEGTKFYEVALVSTDDSESPNSRYFVIRRWGAINKQGVVRVELRDDYKDALKRYSTSVAGKIGRGYGFDEGDSTRAGFAGIPGEELNKLATENSNPKHDFPVAGVEPTDNGVFLFRYSGCTDYLSEFEKMNFGQDKDSGFPIKRTIEVMPKVATLKQPKSATTAEAFPALWGAW